MKNISQETLIMKNNTNKRQNISSVNAETLSRTSGEDGCYVTCTRCNANQFSDRETRTIYDWNQRGNPDTEKACAV